MEEQDFKKETETKLDNLHRLKEKGINP